MGGDSIRGDTCVGIGDREREDIGEEGIVSINGIGDRERGKSIGEGEGVRVISGVSIEGGFSIRGERVWWSLSGLGDGGTQGWAHSDFFPHDDEVEEVEEEEVLVMES